MEESDVGQKILESAWEQHLERMGDAPVTLDKSQLMLLKTTFFAGSGAVVLPILKSVGESGSQETKDLLESIRQEWMLYMGWLAQQAGLAQVQ